MDIKPYLKHYLVERIVSDKDLHIIMSRDEFNKWTDLQGIGGKPHTDFDYEQYLERSAKYNSDIKSNIGNASLQIHNIPVDGNTNLEDIEKSLGFIRWLT